MIYLIKPDADREYYFWSRGSGADKDGESFHIGIDGDRVGTQAMPVGDNWTWQQLGRNTPLKVKLEKGKIHELVIWMREDGARIDQIILTNDERFKPTPLNP